MLSSQSAVLPNDITVSATGYSFNVDCSAPPGVTGAYRTVMTKHMGVPGGTGNITLSGLTIGTTYQIQAWFCGGDAANNFFGGGPALAVGGGNNPGNNNGFGKYIVGTFTANANTKTFAHSANTNEPVINALTIGVMDNTLPTLAGVSIVDNKGGGPVTTSTLVTYTVTFSEDMDANTVSAADFGNAGTSTVTIGAVTETSPTSGVFTVPVTPTSIGTLRLKVNAGAVLNDASGNGLVTTSAILDDTIITISSDYALWAGNYPGVDLSNPNGDADGDGLTNRDEWIWGNNPTSGASPRASPVMVDFATRTFRYTRRAPALSGLHYSIWYSNGLGDWQEDAGAVQTASVPDANGVQTVEFVPSPGLNSQPRLFLRVRAGE